MFKNHLVITLRLLLKNKISLLINILALSSGMVVTIGIGGWLYQEFSFNTFIGDEENIYQVITNYPLNGETQSVRLTSLPIVSILDEQVAGVNSVGYARVKDHLISVNDIQVKFEGALVNDAFFTVIDREFLYGSKEEALLDPFSVVISETMAEILFGEDWPNKVADATVSQDGAKEYGIAGVFNPFPEESTLHFDYAYPSLSGRGHSNIGVFNFDTYVKLEDGSDPFTITSVANKSVSEKSEFAILLQPFGDIYLHSSVRNGKISGGKIEAISLFVIAAIVILLMACLNFANLHISQSLKRKTEICTRLILGSAKSGIQIQILLEAFIIVLFSAFVSLLLLELSLPSINLALGQDIFLPYSEPMFWLILIGVILLTSVISGVYPSIFLTSLKPISVLGHDVSGDIKIGRGKQALFLAQLVISLMVMTFTIGIYKQVNFLLEKDLGYVKEGILIKPLASGEIGKHQVIRKELMSQSYISDVSFVSENLMTGSPMSGNIVWPGKVSSDTSQFGLIFADEHFANTLNIQLKDGQLKKETSESTVSLLVNERAKELMGSVILNENIKVWGQGGEVIGVIDDFHYNTLFNPVEPLVVAYYPDEAEYLFVKVLDGQFDQAIGLLNNIHNQYSPNSIFSYQFLSNELAKTYKAESNMKAISVWFSVLAFLIAIIGFFGLMNFTVEAKMKEVSIRRVLGASLQQVYFLLAKNFLILVGVAVVIIIPTIIYLNKLWLEGFTYKTELSILEYGLPLFLLLSVALITVLYHSFRIYRKALVQFLKRD